MIPSSSLARLIFFSFTPSAPSVSGILSVEFWKGSIFFLSPCAFFLLFLFYCAPPMSPLCSQFFFLFCSTPCSRGLTRLGSTSHKGRVHELPLWTPSTTSFHLSFFVLSLPNRPPPTGYPPAFPKFNPYQNQVAFLRVLNPSSCPHLSGPPLLISVNLDFQSSFLVKTGCLLPPGCSLIPPLVSSD